MRFAVAAFMSDGERRMMALLLIDDESD